MIRKEIPVNDFVLKPFQQFDLRWFILSSGDYSAGKFNSMTISWGSIGYIWRRPFVHVVVRPNRYTYEFMENYDTFTLCSFPEYFQEALNLIGSKSGKDSDKIRESGLTPIPSIAVPAPSYSEAELILECRKIFWGDIDPKHFLLEDINTHYENNPYHRFYYGEILSITGDDQFCNKSIPDKTSVQI